MAIPLDISSFMTPPPSDRPVGYVAIVGRPNAGKSTFLNALIGEKVSIVSPRPQTTRQTTRGIYTTPDVQIIFLDTPGLHDEVDELSRAINHNVLTSLGRADVILRFIDPTRPHGDEDARIDRILSNITRPVIPVLTKADVKHKDVSTYPDAIRISSVEKTGFEELVGRIRGHLHVGHLLYDEDVYTDQDMHIRISEIVREKLFVHLGEELPYSIFIEVGEIEDTESLLRILAYIYVERASQKGIVLGHAGSMLQKVGTEARKDLEDVFGKKVFLGLRVKVMPGWKKQPDIVKNILS